jgi:hypothetical protein
MTFIWTAFASCVLEVALTTESPDPQQQVPHVRRANETVRFNECAGEWAFQSVNKFCEYPKDIFIHLGLLSKE